MASRKNNSISINSYKRKREMNIGIFIFAIVLIYLIVTIIMYASSKKISAYEVREGSILKDNSYTGLIIRQETVVNSEKSGYINYFQSENSKIKAGTNVYAITSGKLSYSEEQTDKEVALSGDKLSSLIVKIQNFNEVFSPQKFSSVYSLKNEAANTLLDASNQTKTAQIGAVIAENGGSAEVYTAEKDGIMVLDFDGYESLDTDSFRKSDFDQSKYKRTSREDNAQVKKGDPAYKLVTSENWSVIVPLDQETAASLTDTTYIKTRLNKENEAIWADFSILKKDGDFYGKLDYDNSMIRYADDRFVNVELIMEDQSGLKIPKSAVVEKDFYQVPEEYLTSGGSSSASGVMVQKRGNPVFQAASTYAVTRVDEEGKEVQDYYLRASDFDQGTVLMRTESSETFTLSKKETLKGVYNINKGYAVFKLVDILCESDEYYIVKDGDPNSLYNYDHIAQDGSTVEDEEVVSQ